MPELPEVETTRRGIARYITGKQVKQVIIHNPNLRYKVPRKLLSELPGNIINKVDRRGKYLLLRTDSGTVIIHLGMSGSLRLLSKSTPLDKHDHVELIFEDGRCLRLRDPRRFGLVLWTKQDPLRHKLLKQLGPEPLLDEFNSQMLYDLSRKRQVAIKQFIMNSSIVVGVGNIYANEALYLAEIHPQRAAGRISKQRYDKLVKAIKQVLREAVKQGGTTLRDFYNGDNKPGYFGQKLNVYGKQGQPCGKCGASIKLIRQGQRASYYCPQCQH